MPGIEESGAERKRENKGSWIECKAEGQKVSSSNGRDKAAYYCQDEPGEEICGKGKTVTENHQFSSNRRNSIGAVLAFNSGTLLPNPQEATGFWSDLWGCQSHIEQL